MTGNLLDDFNNPTVPRGWTDLMAAVHAAEVARETMRLPDMPQGGRDLAVVNYSRAADRVVDLLIALRADHTLGRITNLLAKKDRS